MITGGNKATYPDRLLFFLYLVFFVTIICSFRWVSTFILVLILEVSLIKNKIETGSFLNKRIKNIVIATCCIFYLIQLASLIYTGDVPETVKHLRIKSGLVLIPITLCCSNYLNAVQVNRLMKMYIWVAAAAMLYCFLAAVYKYFFLQTGNDIFFYHALVGPFRQNAVQVSVLLFIGLLYLLETGHKEVYLVNRTIHFLLVFYFMFLLVLLSSKLMIIFSAGAFIFYFFLSLRQKQKAALIIPVSLFTCVIIAAILITNNPVSKRFNEIINGNVSLISRQGFSPGIYFNGLQFRLLQWRFVSEILNEHDAWLLGVSPGDAQSLLNNKYLSTNMYVGENNDGGFLGYNTHNQFLQSTLQSGILGLLSFVLICASLVWLAIQKKNRMLSGVVILLIVFAFNDAYFESQYGVILFGFFPLFFARGSGKKQKTL